MSAGLAKEVIAEHAALVGSAAVEAASAAASAMEPLAADAVDAVEQGVAEASAAAGAAAEHVTDVAKNLTFSWGDLLEKLGRWA